MAAICLQSSAWERAQLASDRYPLECLRASALSDEHGVHVLASDPSEAGIILFVETHDDRAACGPNFERIRAHPVYRAFRSKCLVHCGMDKITPIVRGIFPSIERRHYLHSRTRSGPYIVPPNPFLPADPPDVPRPLLASFIGCAARVALRHQLLQLNESGILIEDNTRAFVRAVKQQNEDSLARLKRRFVDCALGSRFVLCPRGAGASSIRLFETMQLGRAPVIISDQWVPPPGPSWDEFTIRVRERDVHALGEVLRSSAPAAEKMGDLARRAWLRFYHPKNLFHTIAQTCQTLMVQPCPVDSLRMGIQRVSRISIRRRMRTWRNRRNVDR